MGMNAVQLGFDKQLASYVINYNDLHFEKSIAEGMKPSLCYHVKLYTQADKLAFVVILTYAVSYIAN